MGVLRIELRWKYDVNDSKQRKYLDSQYSKFFIIDCRYRFTAVVCQVANPGRLFPESKKLFLTIESSWVFSIL
jgi:hypothetical protein